MFAAFVLEKDPSRWADLPLIFEAWLQSAGGVAAVLLTLFTLASLTRSGQSIEKRKDVSPLLLGLALLFPPLALLLWVLLSARNRWLPGEKALELPFLYLGTALTGTLYLLHFVFRHLLPESNLSKRFLILGGLSAVVMLLAPLIVSALTRMRVARIWALARLSLKEALRNRVVLVFGVMALVFLFADWFVPYKTEDQVRNYVRMVYWSMTPLFLLTATLLGAFGLPADIKSQSIHTIVTKPVERLEIVLGRFLGYGILLTSGLAVVGVVSYLYILRGVTPEAAKESFKARVPIFGNLYFFGKTNQKTEKGESVGREWGYRSYISGPHISDLSAPPSFAVWEFDDLPSDLGEQGEPVSFEFTFDIFRLQKGEENRGVYCTFTVADGRLDVPQMQKLREVVRSERNRLESAIMNKPGLWTPEAKAKIEADLLDKYGFFERGGYPVTDYHTQTLQVPAALFAKLRKLDQEFPRTGEPGKRTPQMILAVNVDRTSHSQLVGVAKRDLYLLAAEQPFWQNFFKGIIGMWFSYMLVLGVAITCSTYLSGVISWLATLFLFGAGMINEYIHQLAEGTAIGGGPFESLRKLATRTPITMPLDPTPASDLVQGADAFYRRWLQLFLHIIPDVNRFDLHHYVANGFDIAWSQVLLLDNFIYLGSYLVLWLVLAFYLLRFREIANPT